MDQFEKKTHKTPRGFTYTYYLSPAHNTTNTTLPTFLLQHGWPDSAAMYFTLVTHLRDLKIPNQILIPDMLGYAGTSKPTNPEAYTHDLVSEDLCSILDAESIQTVISIGHDWGSRVAQRLYTFRPERVEALILLNVAYTAPLREPFNLQATNAITTKLFGYPIFAYWELFTAPDAPQLLKDNVERVYSILHGEGTTNMKRFFCTPGQFRSYLESSEPEIPVRPYAQNPEFKRAFVERMRRDGFDGPQQYYVANTANCHHEVEKKLPEGRDKVDVPVLLIPCKDDAVCRPEIGKKALDAGLLPDFEQSRMIDAAHWVMFENPREVAEIMAEWLGRRFPSSAA